MINYSCEPVYHSCFWWLGAFSDLPSASFYILLLLLFSFFLFFVCHFYYIFLFFALCATGIVYSFHYRFLAVLRPLPHMPYFYFFIYAPSPARPSVCIVPSYTCIPCICSHITYDSQQPLVGSTRCLIPTAHSSASSYSYYGHTEIVVTRFVRVCVSMCLYVCACVRSLHILPDLRRCHDNPNNNNNF